jgi:myo-inositol-1(or 4)-monophosphatase
MASVPDHDHDRDPDVDVDVDALRALAEQAASSTAALLVEGLTRARTTVEAKSSPTDLVTEMDRRAEEHLAKTLLGARPEDGFLGEEGHDTGGTSGVRWIVDPLDGTTNYLYGHPGFAVSVAAELDGVAVAAAVVDPLHRDVFSAAASRGATHNGVPLRRTSAPPLEHLLVATGFGYAPERRAQQAAVLATVLPQVRDIRRMGAAAVDLCWVALGRVDAFYERGLAHWDRAAGALIATEAGCRVGDLRGGDESTGFLLAAPEERFDELAALLLAASADAR